jgi:hypothetical protein
VAPTLIAHYEVYSAGADSTTLTTPSFTPANGEVITVKVMTWDTGTPFGTPTGGSQSYTKTIEAAPGGFAAYAAIWTCTVSGSPGAMTISATPTASCRHTMIVERWGTAVLAASPAVNGTVHGSPGAGSGTFSTPLTTAADNSVITWCMAEENSVDPATRAYLLSATEDGLFDGHVGSNSVHYSAYASVGAAGSYSFGLSAPTGLNWSAAAVEIQSAAVVITPNGLAVPVALGQPAAGVVSASPSGLAVPVALGQPTAGLVSAGPSGLAVTVALGQPTAGLGGVSPNGLPVPVGLGGTRDLSVRVGAPEAGWKPGTPKARWVAGSPTT